MSTQSNLKSFIKSAQKKSSQVCESEPKYPSATVNPCHPDYPDISLMTECVLRDTSLKRKLLQGSWTTIHDFQFPLK